MCRRHQTVFLVIGAVVLVGCQKATEEAMENAIEQRIADEGGSADVELGDETFSLNVTGKDGKSSFRAGAGTKVPDNFPKDVPLYPKQSVLIAHSQQKDAVFIVQATTPDSPDKVIAFFRDSVKGHGWKEVLNSAQDNRLFLLGFEKDERKLNLVVMRTDAGTSLNLTTSQK